MSRSVKMCSVLAVMAAVALLGCSRAGDDPRTATFVTAAAPADAGLSVAPVESRRDAGEAGDGGEPAEMDDLPTTEEDPRSCTFKLPEQSCIPGPDQVDWSCRVDCSAACSTCAASCRDRACQDACLGARDSCGTKCPEQIAAWVAAVRANHGCKAKRGAFSICTRTVKCLAACGDGEATACRAHCEKVNAAGCDAPFLQAIEDSICGPFDYSP